MKTIIRMHALFSVVVLKLIKYFWIYQWVVREKLQNENNIDLGLFTIVNNFV